MIALIMIANTYIENYLHGYALIKMDTQVKAEREGPQSTSKTELA